MSSEIAVRVSGLSKNYHIYPTPRDRLKQFILPRVRRLMGLPPRNYFHEFKALTDIDFEVRRGETFGIVGRNGSGKSTLLQILCGTLAPTTGEVEINGRVAALLELGAGFNPEFTGRENVFMNARVLGLSQEQIETRFDAIAAFADIGEFIERPVKTYSSGMYVRLAFAVIAHVDADILIIDEALSVGDAYFVQKCMRFLRAFMERGTLLFVSHDTGALVNLCSRAALLESGRFSCIDSPKRVVQRYLAALVESNQESIQVEESAGTVDEAEQSGDYRDVRHELINASPLRNDIEVFRFNQRSSSFGSGLARIVAVALFDAQSRPLSWVVGGEFVALKIQCRATEQIVAPIVGFHLMDRLGQTLFGDNTFLSHRGTVPFVANGGMIEASFEFRLPLLPAGDYSFCVAIAEGTQDSHVQHHWVNDALMIRVHTNSGVHGLVGVPMKRIELKALEAKAEAPA